MQIPATVKHIINIIITQVFKEVFTGKKTVRQVNNLTKNELLLGTNHITTREKGIHFHILYRTKEKDRKILHGQKVCRILASW